MSNISITVLSKNSERHLAQVLDAMRGFAEVVIVDDGSEDRTREIAEGFDNVSFHPVPEEFRDQGFGKRHNYATSLAKHDWVLSIDSDEVLSD